MRLPDFLNPRRLEGRIVALFGALLLTVLLIGYLLTQVSIERNEEDSLRRELSNGELVLRRLLVQDAEHREDGARLLERDYGFRSVLGEGMKGAELRDTLKSNLEDATKRRAKAALVAYVDAGGRLVGASSDDAAPFVERFRQLRQHAASAPAPERLVLVQDRAYQLISVPVRAAGLGGWILMAFELDRNPLLELNRLSKLDSVFVLGDGRQRWRALGASAEAAALPAGITPHLAAREPSFSFESGGEKMRARYVGLIDDGRQEFGVVLMRSYDDAVRPYAALKLNLVELTAASVLVFALGSVLFARRISGPLRRLGALAGRLERGDFAQTVDVRSNDEIGELARAFEAMRLGIQARSEDVLRLAYWDSLTGLPNREQFTRKVQEALLATPAGAAPGAPGAPGHCALLMLDLDRFKHVNDVLGLRIGDRLLCSVAERLSRLARPDAAAGGTPSVARLGGDEFAVLLPDRGREAALAMAQRIQQDFETPLVMDDQTVDLGSSIGIVLAPEHGGEASVLLSRAEMAMYAAKRQQSGWRVFDSSLDTGSQDSLSLLSELRRALERSELVLYLQPKVDLKTRRTIAAEALVRWQHPQRGLVPPMQFIPFAERTGFIRKLTNWVVDAAAAAWVDCRARGLSLRISVNLSALDLMDQDLPAKFGAMLARHGVPTSALCLEITESAIMDDPQRALVTLQQLSAMGFRLSIDDFGTGYSSLAYLKRLPVDELKIDKSFVLAMERDLGDAKIVRSTIELAHNLGLSVVAEGLETATSWRLLEALGCDEGQGYFIARPMPAEDFADWVRSWQEPDLGVGSIDTMMSELG
ncbi:MAG: EAL domain-containing protein [Burkholderiales bacterium]|nr:EAL domain-containing protein [Burkholderiales bacterium]